MLITSKIIIKPLKIMVFFLFSINAGHYSYGLDLNLDMQKLGVTSSTVNKTSASTMFSPYEESSIATEFVRQLRAANKVVDIPEVEAYINKLGRKLSIHSGRSTSRFKFFVIDQPQINAFAAVGGAIGIYKGLILKVDSEAELASVLAHEIAHVSQHHIERSVEAAKDPGHILTQALLIAIAVAAGGGQGSQAAIAAAQGSGIQRMINYTRAHEKEADSIGLKILASAGFDPKSMGTFMQKLLKMQRFSNSNLPSYLSTHPLSADRVASAEQRASRMPGGKKNSTSFNVIKQILRQHNGLSKDSKGLKTGNSNNVYAKLALGKYYESAANHTMAQKLYKNAYQQNPGNTATIRRYAEHLIRIKNLKAAKTILDKAIRSHTNNPQINRLMAKLKSAQGEIAESFYWQANYEYLSGRTKLAVKQLDIGKTKAGGDFYLASKIEAKLTIYKRIVALEKENK